MTLQRRLISFASSASSSKGGPRSKENGPDVSLDWAIKRVEIAMMRTPDGHGRLELSRFITPPV